MAARKPTGYKVIAAAAVIRLGKSERYLYRGDEISADQLDEENAKHLLGNKLIEPLSDVDNEGSDQTAKATAVEPTAAKAKAAKATAAEPTAENQTPAAS